MRLYKQSLNTEAIKGTWVGIRPNADGDGFEEIPGYDPVVNAEAPALLLREIPSGKRRELQYQIVGSTSRYQIKSGRTESVSNTDDWLAFVHAVAAWCLLDSKNIEHQASDTEAAAEWSRLIGAPVEVGKDFDLAGHWAEPGEKAESAKAKRLYFRDFEPIVSFISKWADAKAIAKQGDTAGKGRP